MATTTPAFAENGQKTIDANSTETSLRAKAIVLPKLPDYSESFENMSPEECNETGKRIEAIQRNNAEINALLKKLDGFFERMDDKMGTKNKTRNDK